MAIIRRVYDGLVFGLAWLAGASIAAIAVAIALDVILRNFGFRPPQATTALVEYGLLFMTMAAGPWVVRTGGHVAITSFVDRLGPKTGRPLARLMTAACVAILALLAWRAGVVMLERIERGAFDMRSIDVPGWVAYAMLGGGFLLMATEFARLLVEGNAYRGGKASH